MACPVIIHPRLFHLNKQNSKEVSRRHRYMKRKLLLWESEESIVKLHRCSKIFFMNNP
jgi:hypothetical protein